MPDWSDEMHREPEQMTVEQIKSSLMGIASAQNKKVPKSRKTGSKTK